MVLSCAPRSYCAREEVDWRVSRARMSCERRSDRGVLSHSIRVVAVHLPLYDVYTSACSLSLSSPPPHASDALILLCAWQHCPTIVVADALLSHPSFLIHQHVSERKLSRQSLPHVLLIVDDLSHLICVSVENLEHRPPRL